MTIHIDWCDLRSNEGKLYRHGGTTPKFIGFLIWAFEVNDPATPLPEGTHLKGYPEFKDTQITNEELKWYYHGVNKGLLEDVYEAYKLDFELFGYSIPQEIWDNAFNW